jgi:Helix-turn-helix domain
MPNPAISTTRAGRDTGMAQSATPPPQAPAAVASADLMTPAAVADRLGVSTKLLERWRGTGEGPAFVRLTRKTLRYRAADIEAFIAYRVRASTAAA